MIDWFQAAVLGLVQGLTEFLPISSSAHLILIPKLAHWPDQGIVFDVAVHFGTLIAVLGYFRRDIILLFKDALHSFSADATVPFYQTTLFKLGITTLPALLIGYCTRHFIANELRSLTVIAFTTVFYGILLGLADYFNRPRIYSINLSYRYCILIGLAQALALVPGTSRSGITLTAGLLLGLSKDVAARFSFLLAIPTILIACGYEFIGLIKSPIEIEWVPITIGCVVACISAYLCIALFLKSISRISLIPFAVYRIILGCSLLVLT